MISSKLFSSFFQSQTSGGIVLIFCTIFSLILANSPIAQSYDAIWLTDMFGHSFAHWINDGLMAIFFFLIGLELKREIFVGELSIGHPDYCTQNFALFLNNKTLTAASVIPSWDFPGINVQK